MNVSTHINTNGHKHLTKSSTLKWDGQTKNRARWAVHHGDAHEVLHTLPDSVVDCVVTSPPYFWLRDYGVDNQLGHEETVEEYVNGLILVMSEIHRILRPSGLLFLNIGDTYYSGKGESQGKDPKNNKRRFGLRAVDKSGGLGVGLNRKNLITIPWRVAWAMQETKWILRSDIIWNRENFLAEAVEDRPRRRYEHVFMFSKSRKYHFKRNRLIEVCEEDIWTISDRPKPTNGLNTAPFPDELVERCLAIGCKPKGLVLDPFAGSGTTLRVAVGTGRKSIGIDLNPECCTYMRHQLSRL